jgi:hypothetical protein
VRDALADGSRGVTAKIRWLPHAVQDLSTSYEEGRPRWIHCTPLLGQSGSVGIWMIVLVDEEKHSQPNRRFRQAPPVANDVRRPHYSGAGGRDLTSRMDDLDLTGDAPRAARHDDYGYSPSRVASPYGERNGDRNGGDRNGARAHTNMLMDAIRSPLSPRRSINEQRAGHNHSSANSLKGNQYGYGSVDSFQI